MSTRFTTPRILAIALLATPCLTAAFAPAAFAVPIVESVPAADIQVTASSTYNPDSQRAVNLISGVGMDDDRHDNNASAVTMWHTAVSPPASAPAPGLAIAPAWVRFDFAQGCAPDTLLVWNHNQAGLTDRGFRQTKVYGTFDGKTWELLDTLELKRAGGGAEEAQSFPLKLAGKKLKGLILAAVSNYGDQAYGLSAVRFQNTREVAADAVPMPSNMACSVQSVYLHRADGQPGRQVTIALGGAPLRGEAQLEVACPGLPVETIALPANPKGRSHLSVLLPSGVGVKEAAKATFTLRQGAKTIMATAEIPAKRQWTVFLYPHSHVDIGYTQSQDIVEKITVRNLKVGMEVGQASKAYPAGARYVWNPEVVWAAENYLAAATPAQKETFIQAVKDKQVGLDASFAHLNTSACADEELMHYFQGGLRLRRLTGAPVDTMSQMDVPGMSWGLPQMAAQCGIRGILDFPNGDARVGSIHQHFERPFWWVSPDGKARVLYIQGPRYDLGWVWKATSIKPSPYPGYANPAGGWVQDYPPVVDRVRTGDPSAHFIPLSYITGETDAIEREGLPYDYFTMTWSMSDNSLVDADLPDAVKAWNEKYAYPKLVIASSHDIITAYEKKFGAVIPEKHGDLTEYWTDGLGTDALRIGYNRVSKEQLVQAEILRTMLHPKDGDAAFSDAAYAAWRWILLGSEHTWGYYAPERAIAKEVEKVKSSYFEKGKAQSAKVLGQTLALADRADGDTVTVFNALSFVRSGVVALPAGVTGLADESGASVPVQKLASGETVFLATEVPALGAKSWKIAPAPAAAPSPFTLTATTLENDRVKVELDPETGDIAHLVDKQTGHDFVDAKSPYALNSYRYLKGSDDPSRATKPTEVKISAGENGPICASLVVASKAEGCRSLVREVRLTAGAEKVELIDTVDKIATRNKEGVHFGFAFAVPQGEIRMDIPWGVMTPQKDQLPGSNKNWLAFQRFVDISNAERGVTWCATESPLIEVGDITANLLGMAGDLRLWRHDIAPTQTIFSWALNNHWFTNFPLEQGGVIPFHYAILPHGAYDPVVANRFGLGQNRPLLAARTNGAQVIKAPVSLDNPRIFVSTVKPADDGSGAVILRLRSLSDKAETVNLTFPAGAPKSLRTCGGDEMAKEAAPTTLTLLPFGCVSLRME